MPYEREDTGSPDWAYNWADGKGLLGMDQPEEVDAAFEREEPHVGVAVIGLALNHSDPGIILPRIARALRSDSEELRRQATVALAHVARLHHTVDAECLALLRTRLRGNEADDDLWAFVPHRRLPLWLWRHHLPQHAKWLLWHRWRT